MKVSTNLPLSVLDPIYHTLDGMDEQWRRFLIEAGLGSDIDNEITAMASRTANFSPGKRVIDRWIEYEDPQIISLFDVLYRMGQVQLMEKVLPYLNPCDRPNAKRRIEEIRQAYAPPAPTPDPSMLLDPENQVGHHEVHYFESGEVQSQAMHVDRQRSLNTPPPPPPAALVTHSGDLPVDQDDLQMPQIPPPPPSVPENICQQIFDKINKTLETMSVKIAHDFRNQLTEDKVCYKGTFSTIFVNLLHAGNCCVIKKFALHDADVDKLLHRLQHALREVSAVCRFRHRNLLPLMGYCFLESCGTDNVPALCLLYPQLLGDNLKNRLYHWQDLPPGVPLTALQRIEILRGIAEALSYLHNCCQVAHGDVTHLNVLLDDALRPCLIDLGLCRTLGEHLDPHVIEGTAGFVPPEWNHQRVVTATQDVYALGVLCMLCCGEQILPLTQCGNPGGGTFKMQPTVEWLQSLMVSGEDVVLQHVELSKSVPEEHHPVLRVLLKLCLRCTVINSEGRPTSEDILQTLNQMCKHLRNSIYQQQLQQAHLHHHQQ